MAINFWNKCVSCHVGGTVMLLFGFCWIPFYVHFKLFENDCHGNFNNCHHWWQLIFESIESVAMSVVHLRHIFRVFENESHVDFMAILTTATTDGNWFLKQLCQLPCQMECLLSATTRCFLTWQHESSICLPLFLKYPLVNCHHWWQHESSCIAVWHLQTTTESFKKQRHVLLPCLSF